MSPRRRQSRRIALITGAGRNIGRACVLGLAEDGFDIVGKAIAALKSSGVI